jgi:hypothetical protein
MVGVLRGLSRAVPLPRGCRVFVGESGEFDYEHTKDDFYAALKGAGFGRPHLGRTERNSAQLEAA